MDTFAKVAGYNLEILNILEMTSGRAKLTENWQSCCTTYLHVYGIPLTLQGSKSFSEIFWCTFHKMACDSKDETVKTGRNRVTRETCTMQMVYLCFCNVEGHFWCIQCTSFKLVRWYIWRLSPDITQMFDYNFGDIRAMFQLPYLPQSPRLLLYIRKKR